MPVIRSSTVQVTSLTCEKWRTILAESPIFDEVCYSQSAGCNFDRESAISHYLTNNQNPTLSPGPLFDTLYYLSQFPAILPGEEPPLVHYIQEGEAIGMDPHPLFSAAYYRKHFKTTLSLPPCLLAHYLREGGRSGLSPHPLFDEMFVASQIPEGSRSVDTPLLCDYLAGKLPWNIHPNPWFSAGFYARKSGHSEFCPGTSLLEHYAAKGFRETEIKPNALFDHAYYQKHNRDCGRWTNPLAHYLSSSRNGRLTCSRLASLISKLNINEETADEPAHTAAGKRLVCIVSPAAAMEENACGQIAQAITKSHRLPEIDRFCPMGLVPEAVLRKLPTDLQPRFERSEDYGIKSGENLAESVTAFSALCSPYSYNVLCTDIRFTSSHFKPLPNADQLGRGLVMYAEDATSFFNPVSPRNKKSGNPGASPAIIFPILDWQTSGVNTWVHSLATALDARGHHVQLLVTSDIYQYPSVKSLPMRNVVDLRINKSKPEVWKTQVEQYLRSVSPCVLLTAYDNDVNRLAARMHSEGVHVIGVLHSDDPVYYERTGECGSLWDAIVTVSEHIADQVKEKFPELSHKVTPIPYGIAHTHLTSKPPTSDSPLVITYTGRVVQEQKRAMDFPQFIDALEKQGIDYRLNILGDGSDWEELYGILQEKIANGRVHMPGRATPDEISSTLARSQLFLLMSDYEGLPLSLLEAISHGTVPLVTEIPSGIPEVVTHNETGLLYPPGNYQMAARLAKEIQNNPEKWKQISMNAINVFRQKYTVDAMTDAYIKVLDETLKYKPAPAGIIA